MKLRHLRTRTASHYESPWKAPQKLNRRTARWHADLQEYDFVIKHIPGKINTPADELS